jgi:gliding motility-associated-like protein
MEIFNRWGEKLHEITQSDEGWDGLFQGEPVQMGVYIYKLEVISETKKSYFFNGTFTLIR